MSVKGIVAAIIFYFLGRVAMAANCETWSGIAGKEKLCWHDTYKAWISEKCLHSNCGATVFMSSSPKKIQLEKLEGGRNPAAMYCHQMKLSITILKDGQNNEQSFCKFSDSSLIDVNALETKLSK